MSITSDLSMLAHYSKKVSQIFSTVIRLTLFPMNCYKAESWFSSVENFNVFVENLLKVVEKTNKAVKNFGEINLSGVDKS